MVQFFHGAEFQKSVDDLGAWQGVSKDNINCRGEFETAKHAAEKQNETHQEKDLDGLQGLEKTFRVMGPLHIKAANPLAGISESEWDDFKGQLLELKELGVSAVSTDIWWGLVDHGSGQAYDWSYYKKMLQAICESGLNWVPILSFHKVGGNVNDNFNQSLPYWIWQTLLDENPELQSIQDLQYVSETGAGSFEYISLWADRFVLPYYERFMQSFAKVFSQYADVIDEIIISLGPAGELRYPSYNSHDWGDFPNRGTMQCYSRLAKQDYKKFLRERYANTEELNERWKSDYVSIDDVELPTNLNHFFSEKHYREQAQGLDFLYWYNQSLIEHGKRILSLAFSIFDEQRYQAIPLGIKLAGVHWNINNGKFPRVSELTSGIIAAHPLLSSADGREYHHTLSQLIPEAWRSRLVLHFTCLELGNDDENGFSKAADLVEWVAKAAHELGLNLMGENALACRLNCAKSWGRMQQALQASFSYSGLTVLRMDNLLCESGFSRRQLGMLIDSFRSEVMG